MSKSRIFRAIVLVGLSGAALAGVGCADMLTYAKDSRRQGLTHYNEKNYADAAGDFRNAIRQDPRDYRSHYYLGASYEQLSSYQQAIQAYKASLDVMNTTLEGKNDEEFRVKVMDGLASAISKTPDRAFETDQVEQKANTNATGWSLLQLAKVHRYQGDADSAVDSYNRAALLDPQNFYIQKEFGLYLEQLSQNQRAEVPLRRAYSLKSDDEQVVLALRRIGVIPGPALLPENQLAKPLVPKGPIPEVRLPTRSNDTAAAPTTPTANTNSAAAPRD